MLEALLTMKQNVEQW